MYREVLSSVGLMAVVVFMGCAADPAADKPDAEVAEAQPEVEPAVGGTTLAFSDESAITWVGSSVTGRHEGGFGSFDGEVHLLNADPTSSTVNVTIDTTSIWADNEKLTGHLKSADFFDIETYPTATFHSTAIEATETGYSVTGNLNLHGVEKSITFPADIEVTDGNVSVNASFAIQRFDFGIAYTGSADNLIRDEAAITLALKTVAAGP